MCNSLYAINKDDFLNSFITLNNKDCNEGGLTYPSDDVILLCFHTENFLSLMTVKIKELINYLFNQRFLLILLISFITHLYLTH